MPPGGKTRDQLAAFAGVGSRTIQDAGTAHADAAVFEQVMQGGLPASQAARQVRQQQRDAGLPAAPPLPQGVFDLVYADPPWRLPSSADSSRAVENHYPTMPLEEILSLQVPAADNALLFLWAVNSLLPEALGVMDGWRFRYLTNFAWVKDKFGLGQYNRSQHELLLIGRRGSYPPPPENRRRSSVIDARRGRHSEKPADVYELIEAMYPHAHKLELFARGKARPGWTTWGNEAKPGAPA